MIIMAGSTRPLEQVVIDQMRYLASIGAIPADRAEEQISAAEQDAKTIESPALAKSQTVELAGTKIPASYLLDLRDYHPAELAAKLKIPILILQGARDYQVTQADYQGWKQALAGHSNVTFRLYPGFTHLFMVSSAAGTGLGTPADYDRPGHVDEQVIQDIASWLETVSKTSGRNP
jgi:dienelactone hydrolase